MAQILPCVNKWFDLWKIEGWIRIDVWVDANMENIIEILNEKMMSSHCFCV